MKRPEGVIWANMALLSASFFWGITFIAQKQAMEVMGPFAFTGLRFLLGGLCLLPFVKVLKFDTPPRASKGLAANFSVGILILSVLISAGINLQQVGLIYTIPTNSALLTSIYIFLVPIIMTLAGRKLHWGVWVIGAMMLAGIYLLTSGDGQLAAMNFGDILNIVCSLFWALHIIWMERMILAGHNPLRIAIAQSFICGGLSMLLSFMFESFNPAVIADLIPELFFGGVLSISFGFTLQVIGQRKVPPSYAAILLSGEALFAALADYIYFGTVLDTLAYFGALLIIAGVILIQLLPPVKITELKI